MKRTSPSNCARFFSLGYDSQILGSQYVIATVDIAVSSFPVSTYVALLASMYRGPALLLQEASLVELLLFIRVLSARSSVNVHSIFNGACIPP